jgi:lipopolysaccharide biosynthesis protein
VAFLTRWVTDERKLPSAERLLRRPCPGFHPQIYAYAHAGTYDTALINPLAHFIRSGRPDGPWRHDVITPTSPSRLQQERSIPAAALHAHFHYPELAQDLFRKIAPRGPRCDLLLSTDDGDKARKLRDAASGYGRGEVRIRVVPNRGRDIGAFLTGFADDIVTRYQIIGHAHGKRSLHAGGTDPFFGERWREFLWQNLIGDLHPMMDIVLARMADDETLGIVFPEDPYLRGWDDNRATAEGLAARMGMMSPLPPYIDFPAGTMFWARTAALKPLFDLGLGWEDYPREPAAQDGTILNAIERLLPSVVRHAGYRFATTHVSGVTR